MVKINVYYLLFINLPSPLLRKEGIIEVRNYVLFRISYPIIFQSYNLVI